MAQNINLKFHSLPLEMVAILIFAVHFCFAFAGIQDFFDFSALGCLP